MGDPSQFSPSLHQTSKHTLSPALWSWAPAQKQLIPLGWRRACRVGHSSTKRVLVSAFVHTFFFMLLVFSNSTMHWELRWQASRTMGKMSDEFTNSSFKSGESQEHWFSLSCVSHTTGVGCHHASGLTSATALTNFLALIRLDLQSCRFTLLSVL